MKTKRLDRSEIKETSLTFLTTEDQKNKIQEEADNKGITMSAVMRMIIREHFDKEV